jgi:hypothetical protein
MSKTINIILLVSIYFLISCSEMTTLYKKKSRGKIETINTGFGDCHTLNILSFTKMWFSPMKKNRVRIQYNVCDKISIVYRTVENGVGGYFHEEAITDSINGFYQFKRKLNTDGKKITFYRVSIEEMELMTRTMKLKKLPEAFENDICLIIGWIRIE